MPFARPTLDDLLSQAAADLAAAVPGTDPLLPNSNLAIIAAVLAEGFNAEYAYLDYISKQATPFTAVDEAFQGWAALKNLTQKPAAAATDHGVWTGASTTVLPAGTPVSRGDGAAYVTTADAIVSGGGTVTAPLEAVVSGSAGTLTAGAGLVLGVAVAGISSAGAAVGDGTPGVDLETFDAFRTRVLAVYANPPQGGASADYIEWALQVPGVTRAWCVPHGMGPGTVVVYVMMDLAEAGHGGFPQGVNGVAAAETRDAPATLDLLTVANWIFPLQPVTALVYAQAPQANTVTFTISLPGASAAVKAAITSAMDAVFLAYGAPGGTLQQSRLESAIAAISGSAGFVITATACDHGAITPGDGNIVSNAGYIPVRGAVTWV